MFTKTFSTAAVALAAASLVSAQTFTECDPTEKECKPNPGYGKNAVDCDLTQGACDGFYELDGTDLEYNSEGALFRIETESNAPTIASDNYIFFGRLEVELQAAPGQGIVTSIVLQSDCLDEIDWEWVGGDINQVQSNYYRLGDTTTYDRGAYHPVPGAIGTVKTYAIDWTPEKIDWIVNGKVIRTLTYEEAKGGANFPQTPMQIKVGTWVAGGKNSPEGTVEWAGGYTDFSDAPFDSIYKSIKVVDYAGGSSAATFGVKQYVYGDRTGTKDSIVIEKGDGSSSSPPKPTGSVIKPEPETTTKKSTKTEEDEEAETKTKSVIKPSSSSDAQTTVSPPTTVTSVVSTPVASSTTSDSDASPTDDNDQSEETNPTEVPEDAAGSNTVGFATLAIVGVAVLAQLF